MNRPTPTEALAELVATERSRPPAELRVVLAEIWPELHAPLRNYESAALVALFRRAGFVSDGPPQPGGDLLVYRGEPADPASPGIAWSTDEAVATDYARRYSTAGQTRLLQATAPPMAVLARFAAEPRPPVPELIAAVLAAAAGRPVTAAELGMTASDQPADLGLHLPTAWRAGHVSDPARQALVGHADLV